MLGFFLSSNLLSNFIKCTYYTSIFLTFEDVRCFLFLWLLSKQVLPNRWKCLRGNFFFLNYRNKRKFSRWYVFSYFQETHHNLEAIYLSQKCGRRRRKNDLYSLGARLQFAKHWSTGFGGWIFGNGDPIWLYHLIRGR